MFVLKLEGDEYYGPFVSERAAINYAADHGISTFAVIPLHDSGNAMDYLAVEIKL